MVVLVVFAILVIIREILRAILITLLKQFHMRHFNFAIFLLLGLKKTKKKVKIELIKIEKNFLVL